MRALVLKELREHRWVLLALWVLSALGLTGLVFSAKDEGSPLVAYSGYVEGIGVLSILILVNRLVVREYSGRTQLFLETLPVGRLQIVTVKWLTGAILLAISMTAGFAVTLYLAHDEVVLTRRLIVLISARSGVYLLFVYSLAFFIALMGRYRYVLWGGLILGAYCIDTYAQLPMNQWPPFALVASSMVFERLVLPGRDLLITAMVAAFLIIASLTLAVASEGSLVLALSRRMLPRERVVVIVVVLALVSLLGHLDERKPKPVFALHDAITSGAGTFKVAVARAGKTDDAAARALADTLSADLEALRAYLSLSALPGVFVLPDASIDADVFSRATLPSSDGVVVRGAIGAEHFDQEEFRAYAIGQTLDWYTRGRSGREERRWLSDGLDQWWIARASPERRQQLSRRAALAGHLLHAESGVALEERLHHWLMVREQLGDCLSDALAWRAVTLLADDLGPERFRLLNTRMFGRRPPNDARAAFEESTLNEAWRAVNAPPLPKFADALRSELANANTPALPDTFADQAVTFEAATMSGSALEVHYRLGAPNAVNPLFAVRYAEIGAWQAALDRESLSRVDALRAGVLPRPFQRGTMLFSAVELRDENVQCTLRLGARRWKLP